MNMSDELDKKDQDLLEEMLQDQKPPTTPSATQVVYLPSKVTASSGGRALAPRSRPLPTRHLSPQEEAERIHALEEERRQFVASDPVVKTAAGKDSLAVLGALKMEVARETAVLAFARTLLERQGRDGSAISSRRIDALKKIADIELEMKKIGVDKLDVTSEKFQRVIKFFLELVSAAAVATLNQEQADLFFNRLTSEMEGWVDKVADLVK